MVMMLFEDRKGQPIALLAHRSDGTPREPDGATVFTVEQAAAHFPSWSQQALAELWEATFQDVAAMIAREHEAKGETGHPPPHADALADPASFDLMRAVLYPELEPDEFRVFLNVCRERDVNPWLRRLIPKVEVVEKKRRIAYIVTVEQLRIIAAKTGLYEGQTRPRWCDEGGEWFDVWTRKEHPTAAEVGVHVKGFREPIWGGAVWDELVQIDERGNIDPAWEKMDSLMIAKCAEAAAHRKAFPDECGGFYLREELQTRRARAAAASGAGGGPVLSAASMPEPAAEEEDEAMPKTERQFRLAMIDLVGSRRADAVIAGFRREFGTRMPPPQFFAAAVRAVRDNPELYGTGDANAA